jgi:hypothetical protein
MVDFRYWVKRVAHLSQKYSPLPEQRVTKLENTTYNFQPELLLYLLGIEWEVAHAARCNCDKPNSEDCDWWMPSPLEMAGYQSQLPAPTRNHIPGICDRSPLPAPLTGNERVY